MFRNILKRLGYTHQSEFTEDFLCYELAKKLGDPQEYVIEKKMEDEFFMDLSRVNGVTNFLRATMGKDMQRAFGSPEDQKKMVQGAFARTSYFLTKIRNANKPKPEVKEKATLTSSRHG